MPIHTVNGDTGMEYLLSVLKDSDLFLSDELYKKHFEERERKVTEREGEGVESDRIILTHHINKCYIEKYTSCNYEYPRVSDN